MDHNSFDQWLGRYGAAWENRDPEAATKLFTPDALYYWTPFGEPKKGREEIALAWGEATSRQEDVHFKFEVLAVRDNQGIARWWSSFRRIKTKRRVNIEGIFLVSFNENNLCREFREWWHSDEV